MTSDSHADARAKFDSAQAAATYRSKFEGTRKDRWERECLRRGLEGVPPGSHVLDLPCGTGRMTTLLLELGHRVTAADFSEHMLAQARARFAAEPPPAGAALRFVHADVMATPFRDGEFDAVACNRLFHHFFEPATRRRALTELARISRGPIVVSFFRTLALSALKFRVVHALRGDSPTDRVPIPLRAFREDLEACGLRVDAVLPVRFGVSPQTYVRAVKRS
jgi:ubiquinone/menaquinone biosynthesis C-methylase UbiE